ncbi:MAG TPA: helix-turn-helix domain-containing protein [Actinomycetota bacterium]|jgi:predicted ArsR family transcriptional regulator|nr:helix-turn-helix domain-containing protein [Actinomycetota bacterium]
MATADQNTIEVHKALADDTRFRLYRYLGLSGRPVSVRELATRLSLHPNTLRPHLRRLERAGLVVREARRGSSVGRPQTLYAAVDREMPEGRDYRLLAEILAGLVRGQRSLDRAQELAREWGQYLVAQGGPKPGTRLPAGRNLALLQEAMARAGFDPRFHRRGRQGVEISLRGCPARDLLDDHRDAVCAVHRGLLEGMLGGLKPPLRLGEFAPLVERSTCRLVARDVGA